MVTAMGHVLMEEVPVPPLASLNEAIGNTVCLFPVPMK